MATQHTANTESSVLFNLRQLMQLEHERVRSELDAAREAAAEVERAREAADRARVEQVRRAESETARAAREREAEQERTAREREAALLRVRLEAEAAERRASDELSLRHARELQLVQVAARRKRARMFSAALVAAAISASGVHALVRARPVAAVAATAPKMEVGSLVTAQARELAALRELVAHLSQPREAPPPAAAPAPVPGRTPAGGPRKWPPLRPTPSGADHSLDGLDEITSDPISGM